MWGGQGECWGLCTSQVRGKIYWWITSGVAGLVREVVAVRADLKVDWTQAHRREVYASVQSAVSQVLRRRRVRGEQFQFLLSRPMQQARASYEL